MKKFYHINFVLVLTLSAHAQTINISGKINRPDGKPVPPNTFVVNQRTENGVFVNPDNSYTITALKTDTILISAQEYHIYKLCFKDSTVRDKYSVNVILKPLSVNLDEVVITPTKTLKDIQEQEKQLGIIPNTDLNKTCTPFSFIGVLGFSVDLDYIWEYYSHKEREKRKVALLENEELRRTILKEYLKLCSVYNVVDLSEKRLDSFIDYCNFTDNFIKTSTEYELLSTIKDKFAAFQKTETASNLGK